jgi:UDP-glucose 4-epimerase
MDDRGVRLATNLARMSILVTGGAGYIGSVTVEILRSQGEPVVVLDDAARGHRGALDTDVPFYRGAVGDRGLLARILREHRIDACVHFAALAYVGESVQDPRRYFEDNVGQGLALLGGLLDAGVRLFVFSSTCATYGEPETVPIPEEHAQRPANPYGWSKLVLEQALRSYDPAYGLRFVALRYFNAAGATETHGEHHDPETHLVPLLLETALGRRPHVSVFGNDYPTPDGTAIRDYVHVADLAVAHAQALAYLRAGGASDCFNLGTGQGHSVLQVVKTARRVTGRDIETRLEGRRPGDPARLVAHAEKARSVLGWQPRQAELEAIVRSAWDWRVRHVNGYDS